MYPVGWGGSYDPSVDPIVPMEAPPITYDMINGRRTTASDIQQTLRENYPIDWSGGIGGLSGRVSRYSLGQIGQTDAGATLGTMTLAAAGGGSVTYSPILTTDLNNLPIQTNTTTTDLATEFPPAVLAGSQAPTSSQLQSVITGGTNSGLTAAQIAAIVNSAAAAGISVFKATSSPYAIPGTSLVYNPATGQIANSLGLTGSQIAATTLAGGSSVVLIGGGIALLFLVLMMSRGR